MAKNSKVTQVRFDYMGTNLGVQVVRRGKKVLALGRVDMMNQYKASDASYDRMVRTLHKYNIKQAVIGSIITTIYDRLEENE